MSKRLEQLFEKDKKVLNVYLTAGYPELNSASFLVDELVHHGVDMIELGMPFSDPLADGPVIQASSEKAIANGITIDKIFDQVKQIRSNHDLPIMLMGYFNQLLKYGIEAFVQRASEAGVDGFILPDLPLDYYQVNYKQLFQKHDLKMSFLITPQTSDERIKAIAEESTAFLYVVSSYAITGSEKEMQAYQQEFFRRVNDLNLATPKLIGFGIRDSKSFNQATEMADGAIIGSAFIRALDQSKDIKKNVKQFIKSIR